MTILTVIATYYGHFPLYTQHPHFLLSYKYHFTKAYHNPHQYAFLILVSPTNYNLKNFLICMLNLWYFTQFKTFNVTFVSSVQNKNNDQLEAGSDTGFHFPNPVFRMCVPWSRCDRHSLYFHHSLKQINVFFFKSKYWLTIEYYRQKMRSP